MASGAVTVDVPRDGRPRIRPPAPRATRPPAPGRSALPDRRSRSAASARGRRDHDDHVWLGRGRRSDCDDDRRPGDMAGTAAVGRGGTLTNLGSSPSVNVYDANAAGSISQRRADDEGIGISAAGALLLQNNFCYPGPCRRDYAVQLPGAGLLHRRVQCDQYVGAIGNKVQTVVTGGSRADDNVAARHRLVRCRQASAAAHVVWCGRSNRPPGFPRRAVPLEWPAVFVSDCVTCPP